MASPPTSVGEFMEIFGHHDAPLKDSTSTFKPGQRREPKNVYKTETLWCRKAERFSLIKGINIKLSKKMFRNKISLILLKLISVLKIFLPTRRSQRTSVRPFFLEFKRAIKQLRFTIGNCPEIVWLILSVLWILRPGLRQPNSPKLLLRRSVVKLKGLNRFPTGTLIRSGSGERGKATGNCFINKIMIIQ